MTLLDTWVATPAAHALGWTLFHSLWQGAAASLLLAVALTMLRASRLRYAAACLALAAMLAGFGFTFTRITAQQQMKVTGVANAGGLAQAVGGFPFRPAALEPESGIARVLPWTAPFWMAGVVIFHLVNLASWLAARRLRRRGVCGAPALWQQRLDRLGARLRLSRPVTLLESCLAEVPVVIGHLRPVILMPVGLLANLPADQVEAILLHELAHILRYDYLVNLLQSVVEGILFYHPAVWWISHVIRAERENCCDDLVVATSGDAHAYAVALARLEEVRSTAPAMAAAATGGSLVKRIRRLLNQPERPRVSIMPVLSAAALTIAAAVALTAWQAPPAAPAAPAAPEVDNLPLGSIWRKWLTQDVAYVITDEERRAFKALQTDEEREHFSEQFWLRRDPTPGTVENEFKEEYYRRIAYANVHFGDASLPGWKTDRGRIYIMYGPPDEIESHPHGGPAPKFPPYPLEQWLYHYIQGVGNNIVIDFADPNSSGEYRMTTDPGVIQGAKKSGATVQISPDGTALIKIPLNRFAGHPVSVVGRIVTESGSVVQVFDAPAEAPAYTRSIKLAAGSYRVQIGVKDNTTGSAFDDTFQFNVK